MSQNCSLRPVVLIWSFDMQTTSYKYCSSTWVHHFMPISSGKCSGKGRYISVTGVGKYRRFKTLQEKCCLGGLTNMKNLLLLSFPESHKKVVISSWTKCFTVLLTGNWIFLNVYFLSEHFLHFLPHFPISWCPFWPHAEMRVSLSKFYEQHAIY